MTPWVGARMSRRESSSSGWIGVIFSRPFFRFAYAVCALTPMGPGRYSADRHDVLEGIGLHEPQQGLHAAPFELEQPDGLAAAEHGVDVQIVELQLGEVDAVAGSLLDALDAVVDHGPVAQAQEVHLLEAHGFEPRVLETGDDHLPAAVLGGQVLLHGHETHEWLLGQHDTTGMHAGLAHTALDAQGRVDDLGYLGVVAFHVPDGLGLVVPLVLGVEAARERHGAAEKGFRHGPADAVAHRVGQAEDARGVLGRGLRAFLAEGDDLRDTLAAVLLLDVGHDLVASALVDVDVDVGRRDAVGVDEALEDQAVFQRVHRGDVERVNHQRTGGRAAGAESDPLAVHELADVPDAQEVPGEPEGDDQAQLVVAPVEHLLGRVVAVPLADALVDQPAKKTLLVVAVRHREGRHPVDVVEYVLVGLDHAGHEQRVVARAGHLVVEESTHLRCGLDVVAGSVETEALIGVQVLTGADAQQRVVRAALAFVHVVGVIGGQGLDPQLAADLQQVVTGPLLDGNPVVHHLQEVVLLAEQLLIEPGRLNGLVVLAQPQSGLHLTAGAAGGRDDVLAGTLDHLGQQIPVHPALGLRVLPLEGGTGGQLEQLAKTGGVTREQSQVGVRPSTGDVAGLAVSVPLSPLTAWTPEDRLLVEAAARRNVSLDAEDRLHSSLGGLLVELVRAEHVAVVGHRDRGLTQAGHFRGEVLVLGVPVQHRELCVNVQVSEVVRHSSSSSPRVCGSTSASRRASRHCCSVSRSSSSQSSASAKRSAARWTCSNRDGVGLFRQASS